MMTSKLTLFILLIVILSACTNNKQNAACGIHPCSASYAYLGIRFTDSSNKPVGVSNFTAINLRTNKPLSKVTYPAAIDFVAGFVLMASDENIKDFSTDGDNVKVTATDVVTKQTKTAVIKIAGGCNCNVSKVSGPDVVAFD